MHRRWTCSLALLCATAACSHSPHTGAPSPTLAPRQAGEQACAEVDAVLDLIRHNAPADKVKTQLRAAINDATSAARQDSTYYPLRGAIQSLKIALDHDSAQDAQTAVDSISAQCDSVERGEAPIPGSTGR